ncbi:MAG: tetratricopeptide repeat protein [Deltaproteobacteria bacterium]|nr:tetratricopeptide repeat protein [Candidatus Anaeroferrophillus wilburensis]MBN2889307.1 tetratricopeptide repeat protein [Deltaproteobacteria bacterium]
MNTITVQTVYKLYGNIKKNFCSARKTIIFLSICFLLIFIISAYSNSLYAPFTLDDSHSFVKEPKILGFSYTPESFIELTKTKFGFARFLPILSFAVDLQWGGGSVIAFHITNIIIHILTTLSVFFMLNALFSLHNRSNESFLREIPVPVPMVVVFIVGLWSLNPVQTNAVTYLVQRMTSMSALFYIFSYGCYLKGRVKQLTQGFNQKVLWWYFLFILSGACALLSKQISATLPIIVLLTELLFVKDSYPIKIIKKNKIIVLFFIAACGLFIYYKISPRMIAIAAARHFTITERLLTELRIVSSYIFLLLLPMPSFLNLEHDVALSTSFFSPLSTLFSLIFLFGIIFAAWKVREKYPLVAFGIFWFFLHLLIESTIIPLELKFEHRLYLPSVGFYCTLVLLLIEIQSKIFPIQNSLDYGKLFVSFMLIVFSCLSLLTYARNIVWQDSVSLYRDCLIKAPNKPRVHGNLAKALADQGKYEQAIVSCERALELGVKGYEEYWVSVSNIITNLSKMGNNRLAIERAESFLQEAPPEAKKNAYPLFLFNLGHLYFLEHEYQSALEIYFKGLQYSLANSRLENPKKFENYFLYTLTTALQEGYSFNPEMKINTESISAADEKMAEIFFSLNEFDLALMYCDNGIGRQPASEKCKEIKEKIYYLKSLDKIQQVKGTIKDKYFYHPFTNRFNFIMAIGYSMIKVGLNDNFVTEYVLELAKAMQPDNPDALLLHSWFLYKEGDVAEAVTEIEKAVALDEKYAQLWVNRGIYLLALNKRGEALHSFDKALELYPDYPHKKRLEAMACGAEGL